METIFAVASPPGTAARAVLRLSGEAAVRTLEPLLVDTGCLTGAPGFSGRAVDLEIEGDRVSTWVAIFRAPRSYTREDIVEIHLPSSAPLVGAVARALAVQNGVRWALPGEFTLRAFLNGRIDLSQAESVAQLIAATDEREARAARRGLAGELATRFRELSHQLTEAVALLEAALDFADEDLPEVAPSAVLERLRSIRRGVDSLRESSSLRLSARGVLHAVIAGFPNAGKSSLLNAILRRRAALVSDFAGTTRDPVRGTTVHGERSVEWVDVAGRHSYSDPTPGGPVPSGSLDVQLSAGARASIERLTRVELDHADVVLWVLDPTREVEASLAAFEALPSRRILVVNKTDLLTSGERQAWRERLPAPSCLVSAKEQQGISDLVDVVVRVADAGPFDGRSSAPPRFLVSAHQEAALLRAKEAVSRACEALDTELGFECVAADLRGALGALEELAGKVTTDEILGHIFSRFCVGK